MQGVAAIQRTPPQPSARASGIAAQITEVERAIQSNPSLPSHIVGCRLHALHSTARQALKTQVHQLFY